MSEEKKPYWGYRAVFRKGYDTAIGDVTIPAEDTLVLEEVHYDENDVPYASDGGRHIQVTAEEGVEGMIAQLETAIRHLRERGIFEAPWNQ